MAESVTRHLVLHATTIGSRMDAVITEIGAVAFDPYGEKMGDILWPKVFYRALNIQTCLMLGQQVTEQGLMGLLNDTSFQRRVIAPARVGIAAALDGLMKYCSDNTVSKVWATHGCKSVWLVTDTYKRLRKEPPWTEGAIRDVATLFGVTDIPQQKWSVLMDRQDRSSPVELAWAFARTIQFCLNEDDDEPESKAESVAGQQPLDSGTS